MATFKISALVPSDSKREILQRAMEQASSEVFRIAIEALIDPDTLGEGWKEGWKASDSGLEEGHFLWASAELLEFHLKRYFSAKNQLEALS
jgi:hypothetical protein